METASTEVTSIRCRNDIEKSAWRTHRDLYLISTHRYLYLIYGILFELPLFRVL